MLLLLLVVYPLAVAMGGRISPQPVAWIAVTVFQTELLDGAPPSLSLFRLMFMTFLESHSWPFQV